jgi:pimeloyl-ACP methyl ester carboxylesterase
LASRAVGAGTPLLLLHGFGGDHRCLLSLDPVFAGSGRWRRIYVDLPGMGATPAGGVASTDEVAAALGDFVRRAVGGRQFAVVGNCYGGMLARWVAHEFAAHVIGLAVLAGVWVADPERRSLPPRHVVEPHPELLERVPGDVAAGYREHAVVESAYGVREWAKMKAGFDCADRAALARIRQRFALSAEPEDAHPEPFEPPTLVLSGRQDHVAGYADALGRLEHYPRATYAVLDRCGHRPHLDRPKATAMALTDWMKSVRRYRGPDARSAAKTAAATP